MRLARKERGNSSWGITCRSKGDDNENFILLWLGSVVYTFYFDWFFLKPYIYTWKYNDTVHNNMMAAKEISFVIHAGKEDGFISFQYGADRDFLMADNKKRENIKHIPTVSKMWAIPWKQSKFAKHILLNIDGSVYVELDKSASTLDGAWFNNPWDYPGHERIRFTFRDGHDNELITAIVYREKRVWTKGVSWMSWLKYVTKPIVHDSIDLNFDKEVGSRKGSWKGGTMGHGAEVRGNEGTLGSCIRYCEEHGHHFIEFLRGVDDEMVYKNVVRSPRPMEENTNMATEGQGSVL